MQWPYQGVVSPMERDARYGLPPNACKCRDMETSRCEAGCGNSDSQPTQVTACDQNFVWDPFLEALPRPHRVVDPQMQDWTNGNATKGLTSGACEREIRRRA